MNEYQKIRFELVEVYKIFEFLYYLEVIYPQSELQNDFSNPESGKVAEMLWNYNLDKCDKLFEIVGMLVENKQSTEESEYFLSYLESEINKITENKNVFDRGEAYYIWIGKHFE
jgi:hypothetical protein